MWFLSPALSEDANGMVDLMSTQLTHTDLNILHPNTNKNSELLLNPSLPERGEGGSSHRVNAPCLLHLGVTLYFAFAAAQLATLGCLL